MFKKQIVFPTASCRCLLINRFYVMVGTSAIRTLPFSTPSAIRTLPFSVPSAIRQKQVRFDLTPVYRSFLFVIKMYYMIAHGTIVSNCSNNNNVECIYVLYIFCSRTGKSIPKRLIVIYPEKYEEIFF